MYNNYILNISWRFECSACMSNEIHIFILIFNNWSLICLHLYSYSTYLNKHVYNRKSFFFLFAVYINYRLLLIVSMINILL